MGLGEWLAPRAPSVTLRTLLLRHWSYGWQAQPNYLGSLSGGLGSLKGRILRALGQLKRAWCSGQCPAFLPLPSLINYCM